MARDTAPVEPLMRIVAILATYNEERFIEACVGNLRRQGVEVYLIDNESTDRTVDLARQALGNSLLRVESMPRAGVFSLKRQLAWKERVANQLDTDWVMHVDADEVHLPPPDHPTLRGAFGAVEKRGFNAVNFQEFTFVPTREAPDHDHPNYLSTMRWYYPFLPMYPNAVRAWKGQRGSVDLVSTAGHRVQFPGLRLSPDSFPMRHYLYLSVPHAVRKYVGRVYDPEEVAAGWHRVRARLRPEAFRLPGRDDLRTYVSDDQLDASNPRVRHYFADALTRAGSEPG
jgi:glycosyltransferase involved in cell wall biosynthesis